MGYIMLLYKTMYVYINDTYINMIFIILIYVTFTIIYFIIKNENI